MFVVELGACKEQIQVWRSFDVKVDGCGTSSAAIAKERSERSFFLQVAVDLISKLSRKLEHLGGGIHRAAELVWVE